LVTTDHGTLVSTSCDFTSQPGLTLPHRLVGPSSVKTCSIQFRKLSSNATGRLISASGPPRQDGSRIRAQHRRLFRSRHGYAGTQSSSRTPGGCRHGLDGWGEFVPSSPAPLSCSSLFTIGISLELSITSALSSVLCSVRLSLLRVCYQLSYSNHVSRVLLGSFGELPSPIIEDGAGQYKKPSCTTSIARTGSQGLGTSRK